MQNDKKNESEKKNIPNNKKEIISLIRKYKFESGKTTTLIPILTKEEDNIEFLIEAMKPTKRTIALTIVDTNASIGKFGMTANDILEANKIAEKIEEASKTLGKEYKQLQEWGDTTQKIIHTAKLQNVTRIVFVEQNNKYFKDLLKAIKQEYKGELETISIKEKN